MRFPMRRTWCAACAVGLVLAGSAGVRSRRQAEPRALIDKGIRAAGLEKLSEFKALVIKGGGNYYGMGAAVPFTGEWSIQPPGQIRISIEAKGNDMTFTIVKVLNGDKGWSKFGEESQEMSKEVLAEEKAQLYANWVATLTPLKDKAFKLSPAGEVKVDGRPAQGVRVSRKGHRDVSLFFDSKTGLLVKTETAVKDVEGGGDKE